jgi:transposase-like protein
LVPKSTRPKTQPNETPIRVKEEVVALRKETKLCALKLHWRLKKLNVDVPTSTISKILKDEGMVRKYRVKKVKYKYIKAERLPGELLEIDVKYVPGRIAGKRYYQYTAIDTASRWRYLKVYDEQTSFHSVEFLKDVIKEFNDWIKLNGNAIAIDECDKVSWRQVINHTVNKSCDERRNCIFNKR